MELRARAVCIVILVMNLRVTKCDDCPWPREEPSSSPLNAACLCAFNSKNEYSVQCSSVNFPLLMGSLHGRAKNVAFDLLYVNNSEIRELKDRAFLGLQIRNLQISFSEISNISSRAFEGLENTLENLNLQDNHLKEVPTAALSLLQTLNLLDLSGNLLQMIPDNAFQGSSINTLKLSRNVLSLQPEAFNGLESSLKNLNMKGCQLKEVPLAVKRLTSLAFLDLAQNDVRTVNIGILDPLDSLTALNLERNLLQDLEAEVFRGVSDTLSSLSLLNNLLTKFPMEAINSLPQLRVLDIGFNLITKLPAGAFRNVNSLTLLAVDGNPLATIPEEVFKHLNGTLRGLSLGGHYMKCDCRIAWIIKWIKDFDLQVTSRDRDPQFCGQPETLKSKSFYQIEENELVCQEFQDLESNPSRPTIAFEPDISPSRPDPRPSVPPRSNVPPKPDFKHPRPGVALPDVIDSKEREEMKKESGSRFGDSEKVPENEVPQSQSEMKHVMNRKDQNLIPPPPKIGAPVQELTSKEPSDKSSRPTTYSPPVRPLRPPKAPKARPNPKGEVEVQDLNPSFTRKLDEAKRKHDESENKIDMRKSEEAKGGFSREQYQVTDRHPSIVRRPPERPKTPDEFGTSKEDIYGKEVIVQDAFWDSNSINIQWDSETSNILGFRVVYRLFGDKYFKMGQPLAPSSREFKIKNVPPDEYFVACVVSLEEMDIKLENVPFGQCREIRTGDANAQLSTHMDKIIIAASASICGTVIVAVVIFICCFRGKNKKEGEKQNVPAAVINSSSPPLASLGALNNTKGDWDTISMYSQRSIPRARMYHHMDKADDARSHVSQMSSKSRPRSLADGQSQRSFSGMSGVHLQSAAHAAAAHAAQFASPLSLSRPDLRLSRQSLAHPQFGAGYPHFSNGGIISRATSQRSERRRSNRSKSRERTNSRLSHAGSSHSLTGYDTDGWTDHDMDIYMARNPTRGGLVQL